MNIGKDYVIHPFAINLVDVLEVAIPLMTYLIKHVFQIKQEI